MVWDFFIIQGVFMKNKLLLLLLSAVALHVCSINAIVMSQKGTSKKLPFKRFPGPLTDLKLNQLQDRETKLILQLAANPNAQETKSITAELEKISAIIKSKTEETEKILKQGVEAIVHKAKPVAAKK